MIMDRGFIAMLITIGSVFGVLGGIAAFLNAYEGYSRFPAISGNRRIILSLEFAAIVVIIAAVVIVFCFIGEMSK